MAKKRIEDDRKPRSRSQLIDLLNECERETRIEKNLNPFVAPDCSPKAEDRTVARVTPETTKNPNKTTERRDLAAGDLYNGISRS